MKKAQTLLQKAVGSNSVLKGTTEYYKTQDLLKEAKDATLDLVFFKAAIHQTSQPIREKIFRLSELKSFTTSVKGMSCNEGLVKERGYYGHGSAPVEEYIVQLNLLDKEKMVEGLEAEIEALQDEIDLFNATTDLQGYN